MKNFNFYLGFVNIIIDNGEINYKELSNKGNYKRIEINNIDIYLLDENTITNSVEIEWPEATEDWESFSHFAIFKSNEIGRKDIITTGLITKPLIGFIKLRKNDTARMEVGHLNIKLKSLEELIYN
jgi:hypothetical protein